MSAFYFALDRDIRVVYTGGGETKLRIGLENTIVPNTDWYRSINLEGSITVDDRSFEITSYEMDWHFDTVDRDGCNRFTTRATGGQYRVRFNVPDVVYFGTTDDLREAIDSINGPR